MSPINREERENFCKAIAFFFSAPEAERIEEFQRMEGLTFFRETIASLGGDSPLPDGIPLPFELQTFFAVWPDEYGRLFSRLNGQGISLVESSYKPWTHDPGCHLSFAREKGLLQGDSALHVSAIYRQCGMEVAEEFHLSLEMEFLAFLYRWASDRQIKIFIADHLDWISLLKEKLNPFHPHPAYVLALELLNFFLDKEKKRLEIKDNGAKSVH
jgi:putative dimethyl sulfoxide reductase chaperone